jgi:hypothetical protein
MPGSRLSRIPPGGAGSDKNPRPDSPDLVDVWAAAILTSVAERDAQMLGPSAVDALQYAARRLMEMWEDGDGEDGEDGPLAIDPEEGVTPGPASPSGHPVCVPTMFQ